MDREDSRNQQQNGAYILEIVATERTKVRPVPTVSTEITIILTDVNDETPTFRSDSYDAEISENAQENTPLTFLGDTKNGVFDYDQVNLNEIEKMQIFNNINGRETMERSSCFWNQMIIYLK